MAADCANSQEFDPNRKFLPLRALPNFLGRGRPAAASKIQLLVNAYHFAVRELPAAMIALRWNGNCYEGIA
jgi:hypothetical protein